VPFLLGRVRGNSAASPGARAPSFPRKSVGRATGEYERHIRKNITRSYMNGNGKLTETENVIFYVSYGVLTDERNSYVLLQWTATIRELRNGYVPGNDGNHALQSCLLTLTISLSEFLLIPSFCYKRQA